MMKNHIGLFLKVTHKCNLRCTYCYDHRTIKEKRDMSIDTFKHIVNKFAQSFNSITIMFHGGEPLAVGIKWYEEALAFCKSFKDVEFRFTMQSNGVLLNEEWIELLKQYEVSYGISYDGINTYKYRLVDNNKITDKASLYKQMTDKAPGVAMVVNEEFLNNIFEEYEALRPLSNTYRFNYLFGGDVTKAYYDLYIEKMMALFKEWIYDPKALKVLEFQNLVDFYYKKPNYGGACLNCHNSWIGIDSDGLLGYCDFGVNPREENMGSIFDYEDPLDIVYSDFKLKRMEEVAQRRQKCHEKACELVSVCTGGCNAKRNKYTADLNGEEDNDVFCYVNRKMFEKAKPLLKTCDLDKANPYIKSFNKKRGATC